MKNKIDIRIYIIIILIIILGVLLFFYFRNDSNSFSSNFEEQSQSFSLSTDVIDSEETVSNETLVSTTTSASSALTENVELHATYYLEECYVEVGDKVSSGDNILKYTNGKYLTAPYDCVITTLNIPDEEEQCTGEHYVTVSATNLLQVSLSVDESIINEFYLGQEATITISALDDKEYVGYITSISNTASNGKFEVVCEFDNDGEILLGMTASVVIYDS